RANIDEEPERQQVADQRKVPVALLQKVFDENYDNRKDKVDDEKCDGTRGFARGSQLKNGKQRQNNDNRARKDDLPLEMAMVGLVGAHARGRNSSNQFSKRVSGTNGLLDAGFPLCYGLFGRIAHFSVWRRA